MKKYDHETKKWLEAEEYEKLQHSRKEKAKFCRGKKPHDFVLILPFWGVNYNELYKFNPEIYYRAMEERFEFIENQRAELAKLGIETKEWNRKPSRYYMCSVCKKSKYSE